MLQEDLRTPAKPHSTSIIESNRQLIATVQKAQPTGLLKTRGVTYGTRTASNTRRTISSGVTSSASAS